MRMRPIVLFIPIAIAVAWPAFARADNARQATAGVREADNPYCGVLSLYAALRLYGRETSFDTLLKPHYLSSQKGSTPADLERAAADSGLESLILRNLSPGDLRRLPYPVILFTRYEEAAADYNHYVLYVRSTADGAVLLDGSQGLRTVAPRDLPRTWGGVGMILSPEPIDAAALVAAGGPRIATIGAGCLALLGTLAALARWRPLRCVGDGPLRNPLRIGGTQACAVAASAMLGATLYHRFEPSGFLASPDATAAIDQAFAPLLLPTITIEEARDARNAGAVLVDARVESDFRGGHIAGSINVPVGSDADARRIALGGVPKDTTLVLFCKSAECGYSLDVAKGLLRDGYRNMRMFRGGWDEWASTYGDGAVRAQPINASEGG